MFVFIHVLIIALLLITDIIIFCGNSLILIAVLTTRHLQTVTNFYVVSLALADLLVSGTVLPLTIAKELHGKWVLGKHVCQFWVSMDILLCTASILNLCCISIDRYMAITKPLVYATKRSYKLAGCMILIAWILSVIISVPPVIGWSDHNFTNTTCEISIHLGFRIYSSLGSFFIPLILMIFVYLRIFAIANYRKILLNSHQSSRNIKSNKNSSNSLSYKSLDFQTSNPSSQQRRQALDLESNPKHAQALKLNSYLCQRPIHRSCALQNLIYKSGNLQNFTNLSTGCAVLSSGLSQSQKGKETAAFLREHKTAKVIAMVIGCFVVCWLPFFTIYVLESLCSQRILCPYPIGSLLVKSVTWLGYINSALNPFLYAFYNKEYARTFKKILSCKKCLK
uniref:GCR011 n=1 Tax=Schmidtea mediterranea TaxID=79327 RepID=A0A193KU59_SCHMD|nr:GCR011 [Schmidtea mediterranea]